MYSNIIPFLTSFGRQSGNTPNRTRRVHQKDQSIHCKTKMENGIANTPSNIKKKKCKRTKTQQPNPKSKSSDHILLISSLIFTTNVVTAWYKQYYMYASFFAGLTVTSLIFHSKIHNSNKMLITNIADKIFIFSIVLYGGNLAYTKLSLPGFGLGSSVGIVTTFLFCIVAYYYGYCNNKYCFDPDSEVGDLYHAILHIIASVGHHMIIMS